MAPGSVTNLFAREKKNPRAFITSVRLEKKSSLFQYEAFVVAAFSSSPSPSHFFFFVILCQNDAFFFAFATAAMSDGAPFAFDALYAAVSSAAAAAISPPPPPPPAASPAAAPFFRFVSLFSAAFAASSRSFLFFFSKTTASCNAKFTHVSLCSGVNFRNPFSNAVASSRRLAFAISITPIKPTVASGISAFRSHGRSFDFIHTARAFMRAYVPPVDVPTSSPPPPRTSPLFLLPPPPFPFFSHAHSGTVSPARCSAWIAYGFHISRAWTSTSQEMSIPRISATTRIIMNTSSGIVRMFTARISAGRSASKGDTCASSMSIRVSNRMYNTVSAKSGDAFVSRKPRVSACASASSRAPHANASVSFARVIRVSSDSTLGSRVHSKRRMSGWS
eukprot:31136-Pelagococcus_subviridis.AAC.5